MSIDAEVAVLFLAPPGEVVVPGVMDFAMIEDADLHCWISPTGLLDYRPDARPSPLLGEASLEGRLWVGSLGRYWSPECSEYGGDRINYASALRSLTKLSGVENVWYGVLTQATSEGCSDVPAVTNDWITRFFRVAEAT